VTRTHKHLKSAKPRKAFYYFADVTQYDADAVNAVWRLSLRIILMLNPVNSKACRFSLVLIQSVNSFWQASAARRHTLSIISPGGLLMPTEFHVGVILKPRQLKAESMTLFSKRPF